MKRIFFILAMIMVSTGCFAQRSKYLESALRGYEAVDDIHGCLMFFDEVLIAHFAAAGKVVAEVVEFDGYGDFVARLGYASHVVDVVLAAMSFQSYSEAKSIILFVGLGAFCAGFIFKDDVFLKF